MGLFALGVLWLNAGLVFAVAWKQLRYAQALRRRLLDARRRGELVSGTAKSAEGERFAVRRIRQQGRAITTKGPDRILFTDGPQSFEVIGGTLETGEGELAVAATQPAASEVWLHAARLAEGTACDGAAFERAWGPASTFKGYSHEVELEVRSGDRVWVFGTREGDTLRAGEDTPLVVSLLDPIAFASSRIRLLVGFLIAGIIALSGVTAVALWPPHFGVISAVGGALCLAYFLAIQPLGTAVRDAVKTPARALVGARWDRPTPGF